MSHSRLQFIFTEQNETVRQKELSISEARSHAAKVSHMRRRYNQQQKAIKSVSHDGSVSTRRSLSLPLTLQEHDSSEPQDEAQHDAPPRVRHPPPPHGLTKFLRGGSSDPFDSKGFKITPAMTRIIYIAKTSFLPSLYVYPYIKRLSSRYPVTVNPSSTGGQLAEGNVGIGFSFEESTSAWICNHATSLLRFHEGQQRRELVRMILQLKLHSLSLLRNKVLELSRSTRVLDMSLIMHVIWLHGIECMARDWDAAKAHARALSVVLDSLKGRPEMLTLTLIVQFNDIELSVRAMRRTTVDFEDCFGKCLQDFMDGHSTLIPQPPENDETLHECLVSSAFLQPICARLRHFLVLSDSPDPIEAPKDPSGGNILWLWISTTTQQDAGRLLNRSFDLTELQDKRHSASSLGLRYTEACLAITTLHLLRKYFHESPMKGVDLRDASHSILKRLRYCLKLAIKHSTPADVIYYREAFLWMFFAGAQNEARLKSQLRIVFEEGDTNNSDLGSVEMSWFSMMLAEQANILGATTWSETRKILQKFLYTDYYEPHGEKWYEATVDAYARSGAFE